MSYSSAVAFARDGTEHPNPTARIEDLEAVATVQTKVTGAGMSSYHANRRSTAP